MKKIQGRTESITAEPFTYCPGCSHGIVHRLIAESIDELGIKEKTIGVSSIGCSVRCWKFLDYDFVQGAHGRGMAVATGIKRSHPDKIVFTYQGDGDLMAIGMAETIHAAARGENISVIFVNNTVFGATGGQMAPTTLVGQRTITSPEGRDPSLAGKPIRMSELLSTIESTVYIERVALNTPANVIKAKKAVKKAFEMQVEGKGFAMVELLAACPSNLKLSPVESLKWVEQNMIPYYPLGVFKAPQEVE
jgi:2-oxoglutarate ferredoxin oxidoreductase subunit beta